MFNAISNQLLDKMSRAFVYYKAMRFY